jgi:hypothetical protein
VKRWKPLRVILEGPNLGKSERWDLDLHQIESKDLDPDPHQAER